MTAHAEHVPVIRYRSAAKLVAAAITHARENGWSVAVLVVDPWGEVVASGRMDGVAPGIMAIATDKAYTAALGKTTRAFFERMSSSPDLTLGLQNRPRFCAWEGGLPIVEDGRVIGAIGVSGAAGHEDVACGEAALRVLGEG